MPRFNKFATVLPFVLFVLAPVVLHTPFWLARIAHNPLWFAAGLTLSERPALAPGLPGFIDFSAGWITQASGGQAAQQWLSGHIPWWDSHSGVGLPLAAEMESTALFFPFVLLLAAPGGYLLLTLLLQFIAAASAYQLMLRIGLSRFAAAAGALLFELGGSFAWSGMPYMASFAFLPLFLLGLERARAAALRGGAPGYRTVAVAVALSLAGGFPETAYIDGLMALAWAVQRLITLPAAARRGFAVSVAAGGLAGLALAAPVLIPFAHLLTQAALGMREGMDMSTISMPEPGDALYMLPYVLGPIAGYSGNVPSGELVALWGRACGYLGPPLAVAAVLGLAGARRPTRGVRFLLGGWILACLVRSAAVPVARHLWDFVPALTQVEFFRYSGPSWMLAASLLAAFALDDRGAGLRWPALAWSATVLFGAATAAALLAGWPMIATLLASAPGYKGFLWGSLAWGVATSLLAAVVLGHARRPVAMAGLLLLDASVLFMVPLLSGPRRPVLDTGSIAFLQANLGLQRFYTLGPFEPNYAGMFGLASINHMVVPLPHIWPDWVKAHLDSRADPIIFLGGFPPDTPNEPTHVDALRANLPAFAELGVRFVLADRPEPTLDFLRIAHQSARMTIYEVPGAAPYVEAGPCAMESAARERVVLNCPQPARLLRRELWFPGWHVSVNGTDQSLEHDGPLFQAVALPAGRSEVVFSYRPPGFSLLTALFVAGCGALLPFHALRRRVPAHAV